MILAFALLAFALLAFAGIAFAVLHIDDRPGLFAGVILGAYSLSIYFGPIGTLTGLFALLVSAARLARRVERPILAAEAALLCWVALCLLGLFYSWYVDNAVKHAAMLIGLALSSYLYGRAFGDHPRFVTDFLLACSAALLLCEPGFILQGGVSTMRLSGSLNAVGASVLVDTPIVGCLAFLILGETRNRKAFAGVAAFLVFLVLPIAVSLGTRGVFAGAAAALAVLLVRRLAAGGIGRLAGTVSVAGGIVVLGLGVLSTDGGAEILRGVTRITTNFAADGTVTTDGATLDRLDHFQEAARLVAQAPVFGHGLGAFFPLSNSRIVRTLDPATDDVPHNLELEILVNTGFVGLALFLAGFLPIALAGLRAMFRKPLDWTSGFVFCALLDSFFRHQLSLSVVDGKTLFLLLGLAAARNHPSAQTNGAHARNAAVAHPIPLGGR